MKNISNATICNVFYIYWVATVIYALYNFVSGAVLLNTVKMSLFSKGGVALLLLAIFLFTVVVSAFTYIICDRALLDNKAQQKKVEHQ